MSRFIRAMLSMALVFAVVSVAPVGAQSLPEGETLPEQEFDFEILGQEYDFEPFNIKLRGITVVPAISTEGHGTFEVEIVGEAESEEIDLEEVETLEYSLTYEFPPGTEVIGAEARLGRKLTNGGIIAVLCATDLGPADVEPVDVDPVDLESVDSILAATDAQSCPVDEEGRGSVEGFDLLKRFFTQTERTLSTQAS